MLFKDDLWHLEIPAGPSRVYRLAQLDDYSHLRRSAFPWKPPLSLQLSARASCGQIPGTWGFGLWNEPFSASLGFGGGVRHFPVLPNAAWFFISSSHNYLSLRDDLPAQGAVAATFCSPHLPMLLLALGALSLPLFFWKVTAKRLRQIGRRIIHQDSTALSLDLTQWHLYSLTWMSEEIVFYVDGTLVLRTEVVPRAPLGLVIWIDNQFAALPPSGALSFGTLENLEPAWIEVKDIEFENIELPDRSEQHGED